MYSNGAGLGSATTQDLELWRKKKPEIFRYTDSITRDLWLSPVTGEETDRCPWLRKLPKQDKYKCRIYDLRPGICKCYPVDIEQMIQDGCEMLEDGDLEKSESELLLELEAIRNMPEE